MFQIDLKSRKSIYEQVVDNFRIMIIRGVLKEETKIPSVRELSRELTVNPNTVQKAYRELERQGFIYTVSGRGCFVAPHPEIMQDNKRAEEIMEELKALISELLYIGMDREKIIGEIQEILDGGGVES